MRWKKELFNQLCDIKQVCKKEDRASPTNYFLNEIIQRFLIRVRDKYTSVSWSIHLNYLETESLDTDISQERGAQENKCALRAFI